MMLTKSNNNQKNNYANEAFKIIDEIKELFEKEELENVKKHMRNHNFPLPDSLIADGNTRVYDGSVDGKLKQIRYFINIDPLESDPYGPLVIANYGITNEKKTYTYSSLAKIN